jgi:hypothetical protein
MPLSLIFRVLLLLLCCATVTCVCLCCSLGRALLQEHARCRLIPRIGTALILMFYKTHNDTRLLAHKKVTHPGSSTLLVCTFHFLKVSNTAFRHV